MAATRPMAVASSASAIPGATMARLVVCDRLIPMKLFMMPQTVPNRATKGEMEPIVARRPSRQRSSVRRPPRCGRAARQPFLRPAPERGRSPSRTASPLPRCGQHCRRRSRQILASGRIGQARGGHQTIDGLARAPLGRAKLQRLADQDRPGRDGSQRTSAPITPFHDIICREETCRSERDRAAGRRQRVAPGCASPAGRGPSPAAAASSGTGLLGAMAVGDGLPLPSACWAAAGPAATRASRRQAAGARRRGERRRTDRRMQISIIPAAMKGRRCAYEAT